jgi:uncharacterized protein
VPKHDVCPQVHESLVSGTSGEEGEVAQQDQSAASDEPERPNPFAALRNLKPGGSSDGPDGSDDSGGSRH